MTNKHMWGPLLLLFALAVSAQLVRRAPGAREEANHVDRHIILNVLVTDASGNPISGLQQQDFTVLDRQQPQTIASFQAVEGPTAKAPVHIIFMLDNLNNSFATIGYERRALEKYLRSNHGQLSYPSSIAQLSDSGVKVGHPSIDGYTLVEELKKIHSPVQVLGSSEDLPEPNRRFQTSIRSLTRLAANQVDVPGRVILIWLGPGWPSLLELGYPPPTEIEKRRLFRSIVDLSTTLREAQMTLDVVCSPDLTRNSAFHRDSYKEFLNGVRTANEASSSDLALQVLAYQSGGRVGSDARDLAGEIAQCIKEADSYYMLSFDSVGALQENEYRTLQIRVDRPSSTPRTNTAYYAQP